MHQPRVAIRGARVRSAWRRSAPRERVQRLSARGVVAAAHVSFAGRRAGRAHPSVPLWHETRGVVGRRLSDRERAHENGHRAGADDRGAKTASDHAARVPNVRAVGRARRFAQTERQRCGSTIGFVAHRVVL
jgi:hypothetical protein